MDQSLMDELFERIKILEQENKTLQNEYNNLDKELNQKKAELSSKNFLSEEEKKESEKKNEIFLEKFNKLNKLLEDNLIFPEGDNVTPTLKNKNFDETEIMNYFQLLNKEKKKNIK